MSEDIFKKNINNKLNNFEIEPPKELWLNIEKEIDRSKRRYRALYITFAGIAASVLVAIAFNHTILQEERENNYQIIYSNLVNTSEPIIQKQLYADFTPTIKIKQKRVIKEARENIIGRKKITPLKNNNTFYKKLKNTIKKEHIPEIKNSYINYSVNNIDVEESKKKELQIGFKVASGNSSSSNSTPINEAMPRSSLEYDSPTIQREVPISEVNLHTNITLNIEYPLNERLSLSSGIGYLGFSNKRNKDFVYSEIDELFLDDNFLKEYNDNDISKIRQNFSFLEIPILLKYTIINKKISLFATAGIGIDFLIKNKSEIIFDNDHKISTEAKDILKTPTCSIVGIGLSTCLYKSIYVNAEAQYRHYIKSISNNEAISIKQSMPNISIGLSYKL